MEEEEGRWVGRKGRRRGRIYSLGREGKVKESEGKIEKVRKGREA